MNPMYRIIPILLVAASLCHATPLPENMRPRDDYTQEEAIEILNKFSHKDCGIDYDNGWYRAYYCEYVLWGNNQPASRRWVFIGEGKTLKDTVKVAKKWILNYTVITS